MDVKLCESYLGQGFCFLAKCCDKEEHLQFNRLGTMLYTCPKCGKAVIITLESKIEVKK